MLSVIGDEGQGHRVAHRSGVRFGSEVHSGALVWRTLDQPAGLVEAGVKGRASPYLFGANHLNRGRHSPLDSGRKRAERIQQDVGRANSSTRTQSPRPSDDPSDLYREHQVRDRGRRGFRLPAHYHFQARRPYYSG
jgi:hypothetical protein